jgi:hypothetical protein
MTVFLVGGVAWIGSHDLSPRKPIVSTVKPLFVIGMMNFVVPLQLGVRDMAFPTLNSSRSSWARRAEWC